MPKRHILGVIESVPLHLIPEMKHEHYARKKRYLELSIMK